jgi:tetratricopeptide (TPR) repeat protein
MVALMEAYGAQLTGIEGTLEILRDENSAPLATMPLRIGAGPSPEIATASVQFSTTALPPGRYLARGVIRQGGKPQGHLLRPFRVGTETANAASGAAVPAAGGALPAEMITVLLGGLPAFDRKELLTPAMLTAMFASADARPGGSKAAVKEARGGDLGGAAMTALGEGDQVLAMFLKGLELYQQAQLDRAAMQFQNSMQLGPAFSPSRLYLGATLAEANRHREAAGLLQAAASTPPNAAWARLAGEEWIKAGQPALAITPLELAVQQPNAEPRARKLLGVAYVLGGRPADAVATLTPYLDANPTDAAALIAAIFGTYIRHLSAPQPATLTADRATLAKWAKAYAATKSPMQPLVESWVKHIQSLK